MFEGYGWDVIDGKLIIQQEVFDSGPDRLNFGICALTSKSGKGATVTQIGSVLEELAGNGQKFSGDKITIDGVKVERLHGLKQKEEGDYTIRIPTAEALIKAKLDILPRILAHNLLSGKVYLGFYADKKV